VTEFLNGFGNIVWIVAAALAVIALAAAVYAIKTAFGPLGVVLQWLFAYAPGEPNEAVAGISFGVRMLVWAAVVAAVVWFTYQWRFPS
jgi:hypothetical protein